MKKILLTLFAGLLLYSSPASSQKPLRVLVITGGHDYNNEEFNRMLDSFGKDMLCTVMQFPDAFSMFKDVNRSRYDVLVMYHMWQEINEEQASDLSDCIKQGKPLVVLHHSICAFDDWPEYINIIGGKYFHKPTTINGKEYEPCSYIHNIKFNVSISDPKHPVTKGINDFEIFDETYKGYYVSPDAKPLLTTGEASSSPVIGWIKNYGKAKVVTLQSGHDTPTYQNETFRRLLKQSILWVAKK